MKSMKDCVLALMICLFMNVSLASAAEDWPQLKFDSRHSGDAFDRTIQTPLGLLGAIPLSDAVLTAPVIAEGCVYVVDAAGVAYGINLSTREIVWRCPTKGGEANCNNVSSPAVAGDYLHFGTMSGCYYVLDRHTGTVVREIACGEPIFGSPVVSNGRVYFVTLGSRVHALQPDGTICWTWDYVRERLGFVGNRFDGAEWLKARAGRVTTADQFCCAWNPAAIGRMLVVPAGGAVVWLEDGGERPAVRAVHVARTPTLGLSIGADGVVYRQWHRLDNGGRVDKLRLVDDEVKVEFVPGTQTSTAGGLLSFCSVSLRADDVYRCRPEEGFGLCRHRADLAVPERLADRPSIAAPVLLAKHAIYGTLDGTLQVVALHEDSTWSFSTAAGKAISAPVAVSDGCVCFGCDDGYLYILGPEGTAAAPTEDRKLWAIRAPLPDGHRDPSDDWFTSFGNWGNTNVTHQPVQPPFRLKWIRRFEGTTKHSSTCGGGRMYTHTAEGQIFAVEQETGRLLWRRYFPGVHICYTSPLYFQERVLVPQAGLQQCRLRCLDASTGDLLWEAPFAGSPSWNRQIPPVVHGNLAIYAFSTGKYEPDRWLVGHGDIPSFPADQKPLVRAYDLKSGAEVWTADFSQYGSGGDDAGLCLMNGTVYYSCFLGFQRQENSAPRATGVTAAIDPATGAILWVTTEHAVHSGCTISAADGRLYLGGYSPIDEESNRVWCLDARDGSLIWQSDPIDRAIHVITIGDRFLFTHAQYENGYLIDKQNGAVLRTLTEGYKCTRFTFCEPYLFGANMDIYDLADPKIIVPLSTGPALDPSQCVGAFVSNGRIYYTSHGSGLQVSQVYGSEAEAGPAPWLPRASEHSRASLPR